MGLRNVYRVFRETRSVARQEASLAVTGDSPRAAEIAARLGAQRDVKGAEIILAASGDTLTLSGKAVERSEEHTSELQSRQYLVCRLLLEKKKNIENSGYTT